MNRADLLVIEVLLHVATAIVAATKNEPPAGTETVAGI